MKRLVTAAAVGAALILTGCGGHHAAADAAHASAFATSSAGQFDKAQAGALAKKCLPQSSVGLVMLLTPTQKGQEARGSTVTCFDIPAKNRPAFETAFWNSAEKLTTSGGIHKKASRDAWLEVTVPELLVKYHG